MLKNMEKMKFFNIFLMNTNLWKTKRRLCRIKREAGAANVSTKAMYRLYRSDAFGNSNEVSQAEYE